MIRFSYSNEDIEDREEEEGLMAAWAHRLDAAPSVKRAITLNTRCITLSWYTGCSRQIRANWLYLAITGLRYNNSWGLRLQFNNNCLSEIWASRGYKEIRGILG